MDLWRSMAVLFLFMTLLPGCGRKDGLAPEGSGPLRAGEAQAKSSNGPGDTEAKPPGEAEVSERPRDKTQAPAADLAQLTEGNTAFALDLLRAVGGDGGNTMISPHSISLALAMAYAGAEGETREQMRQVLHFTLDDAKLHAAFGSLDLLLSQASAPDPSGGAPFTLDILNQIYAQKDLPLKPEYLDTLSVHYGAGLRLLNFAGDPNGARQEINDWVAKRTRDRIKDLLPEDSVHDLTVCVLVSAVYFLARWAEEFEAEKTAERPFHPAEGEDTTVSMMHKTDSLPYAEGPGYQAVSMPYLADRRTSMVVILPEQGTLDAFLSSLDAGRLRGILGALAGREVELSLPKFEFESAFPLKSVLQTLDMTDAFDKMKADFSGITDTPIWIDDVIHKTFVAVHERGTEAAAATAAGMEAAEAMSKTQPVVMTVDHPFLFLIRDGETGQVLFLGRVTKP